MARRKRPDTSPLLPSGAEAEWLDVLCEDAPVIAVNKPAGMLCQGAPKGTYCLPDYVKAYLKQKYEKPGNVYLGVVHRLDRPVTGVVIFSKNSKGAARLSEQFRERSVKKVYLALLEAPPPEEEGVLKDLIRKIPDQARAEINPRHGEAKPAELQYRVLGIEKGKTLVEVLPLTGRMHQIRLQFASRGCSIVGDQLYGAKTELNGSPLTQDYTTRIALHASAITFQHPVRYDELTIRAPLPKDWPSFSQKLLKSSLQEAPSS